MTISGLERNHPDIMVEFFFFFFFLFVSNEAEAVDLFKIKKSGKFE